MERGGITFVYILKNNNNKKQYCGPLALVGVVGKESGLMQILRPEPDNSPLSLARPRLAPSAPALPPGTPDLSSLGGLGREGTPRLGLGTKAVEGQLPSKGESLGTTPNPRALPFP